MSDIGRVLIFFGIVIIIVGVVFLIGPKIPFLGKLPGDIFIKKGNFTFYSPIATSIILSIILTILLNIFFRK